MGNGKRMQAQQQPSFGSNNNRKSIVYTKEMSAPKFNAARVSRKRSNDRTDFAMDDDDVKSIEREGVAIDENGYALNAIDANVENATNIRSSSEDEDDAGLVMLDDEDVNATTDDDDKEHGLTKFGGMIDSESDDEEDCDDEFMFNDEESDDSDALPMAVSNSKDALLTQLYSASDGYAFFETQKQSSASTLKSRNNRFYNHLLCRGENGKQRDKKDDIFE